MRIFIQAMSDHYLKLVVCFIVLLGAGVQGYPTNITKLYGAVETGAVCLDGSPPSYYLDRGSGDGANNWLLFLQGGGWCNNVTYCIHRVLHDVDDKGGSGKLNQTIYGYYNHGILSTDPKVNPDFYNWNRVHINYCDLASFTGNVKKVNPKNNLHFRGSRVYNAIIEDLLVKGLNNADNAILSGQSAGGLAALLHCDQFRSQVPNANRVKCLSDAGYFIRGTDIPGIPKPLLDEPYLDLVALHGMEKFLPKSCKSKMRAKLCLYPENFIRDMQTPIFLVNSAFDSFHVKKKVMQAHTGWEACRDNLKICSHIQLQAIRDLRKSFINALPNSDNPSVGMFITSCYLHGQILTDRGFSGTGIPPLKNKTVAHAFGDWYFDRVAIFQEIDPIDTPINCTIISY